MTRTHALDALVPATMAVALAWLGTAWALGSDSFGIDGRIYLVVAFGAVLLVVLACVRCWHTGVLAGVGVTAGLWQGAAEAEARMNVYSGGWMSGFNDIVYLVPLSTALVTLIAVVTCAATGTCPSPTDERPCQARPLSG